VLDGEEGVELERRNRRIIENKNIMMMIKGRMRKMIPKRERKLGINKYLFSFCFSFMLTTDYFENTK
jgi:hypothetical protein